MSVVISTNVEASCGTLVDVVIVVAADTSFITDGRIEGAVDATSVLTNGGIYVVIVVIGKFTIDCS